MSICHESNVTLTRKKKKSYCSFNNDWLNKFEWLIKRSEFEAECRFCCRTFSVKFEGAGAIRRHSYSAKHKTFINLETNSQNNPFIKISDSEDDTIMMASEITATAYGGDVEEDQDMDKKYSVVLTDMNMSFSQKKAQAVLWLAELKSASEVQQRWIETYFSSSPSNKELATWMRNFKTYGNVNSLLFDGGGDEQHSSEYMGLGIEQHSSGDMGLGNEQYDESRKRISMGPCNGTRQEKQACYRPKHNTTNNTEETYKINEQSECENEDFNFKFACEATLENIRKMQENFCTERTWGHDQSPRNILLALVGEIGELAELFQWKGEVKVGLPEFSGAEKIRVGEEMSDVLIYLIWLADRCRVDLPSAALEKLIKNANKYPANKVYGNINKPSSS